MILISSKFATVPSQAPDISFPNIKVFNAFALISMIRNFLNLKVDSSMTLLPPFVVISLS